MARVTKSPRARRDLDSIRDYIAMDSPAVADRLLRSFDERLALLAEMPGLGAKRDELAPRLGSFPVGAYLLFYRPTAEGIELVRVLHGARELRRLFRR